MLYACPRFTSGIVGAAAEAGTDRHVALGEHFNGDPHALSLLDEEQADAVTWAVEYIRCHAPLSDYPIAFEVHVSPMGDDFEPLFPHGGTADAICGAHLFDLKWRKRDYSAQMAAYALALFERGHKEVTVHVLYGEMKYAERYKLYEYTARGIVMDAINRASNPDAKPTPCDYCGWCANRLTCAPFIHAAKTVAAGYADEAMLASVTEWHPSQMTDANQVALGLTVWRELLKPWGDSMEYHAREFVMKQGRTLPGFELKERKGKSYVADVGAAHAALAIEPSKFLSACEVRMNTSKKYPDKRGIIDVFAEAKSLKKATAAKEVKRLLEGIIVTGQPTQSLVAVGAPEETQQQDS